MGNTSPVGTENFDYAESESGKEEGKLDATPASKKKKLTTWRRASRRQTFLLALSATACRQSFAAALAGRSKDLRNN